MSAVEKVEEEIKKVEEEIKKVEAKIEKVEEEIENEKDTEERKQLRDKEKQLRDKEKQLNDRLNILLQQQQQQQPNTPGQNETARTFTIKLKYKTVTEYKWVTSKVGLTFVALAAVARKVFKLKVAKLEFTHNGIGITEDVDVAGLNDGSLVQVENRQVKFSSVTKIQQALKLVGRESSALGEDNTAFPTPLTLDDSDDNVKHAIETIKRLQNLVPIVGGCEATRRLYIDPILCAAGLKVGDITMTVEKTVEDARFNGDIDYLFSFNDIIICVTEGKKDQLDNGIAQNIAQLSSVRANRKRKIDEISFPATFGIATTFVEWVFIKYEDERVVRSTNFVVDPANNDSITSMVGRISGLLQRCKSDAGGGQPSASRQK